MGLRMRPTEEECVEVVLLVRCHCCSFCALNGETIDGVADDARVRCIGRGWWGSRAT